MIVKQCGKVIEKKGDTVIVEIAPDSACEGCGGCEQSSKSRKITVRTNENLSIGDAVEIEIDSKDALKAGAILFLFPVLGLLAGAGLAVLFTGTVQPLKVVISGFAGALLPVFFIRKFFSNISLNRKISRKF